MDQIKKQSTIQSGVVAKALTNVIDEFSLSPESASQILGIDLNMITKQSIEQCLKDSDSLELALMLIKIYRSLYAIVGGSQSAMTHWLTTDNRDFHGHSPLEQMRCQNGLTEVARYLETMKNQA